MLDEGAKGRGSEESKERKDRYSSKESRTVRLTVQDYLAVIWDVTAGVNQTGIDVLAACVGGDIILRHVTWLGWLELSHS